MMEIALIKTKGLYSAKFFFLLFLIFKTKLYALEKKWLII